MRVSRVATILAIVCASQSSPSRARAAPPKAPASDAGDAGARAAALRAEGHASFDAKRYVDALAAYAGSYALVPDPALLYNQGRACTFLGRYPEALAFLRRFRAEAPASRRAEVPALDALID